MRRPGQEEVAEAARRRLELLRWELEQAGLAPSERPSGSPAAQTLAAPEPVAGPAPESTVLPAAGRHLRRRSVGGRLAGWLGDRMPATLRGRVALGTREAVLVVCLLATGLLMAGVVALRSGSGGAALPAVPAPALGASATPAATTAAVSAAPSGASPAGTAQRVVVDVAGRVRHPGVVTLPGGSRVIDALRRAGGVLPRVSLASLNLARVLVDGEQILVGEPPAPGVAASAASSPGASPGVPRVSLNSADAEQLDTLPGVGPVTAEKILAWRSQHGAFSSVDELLEVDGIGEKTLADLAPYVTL